MYLLEAPKDHEADDEHAKFAVFAEACRILEEQGIPYIMGGGVAIRAYGRKRPLKDADIFLEKKWVFPAMDALTRLGGFHTREMDAAWLYKALKNDILVDIIVKTTGNIPITEETYAHTREAELYGYKFRMMGPEDLMIRKILSHKEGRPDMFDYVSMFVDPVKDFDWPYFMKMAIPANYRKVLGALLWVQAETDVRVVPDWVICHLTEQVLSQVCDQPKTA
jgi:Nucleotidyl transferase of unknown function (DUF2204)